MPFRLRSHASGMDIPFPTVKPPRRHQADRGPRQPTTSRQARAASVARGRRARRGRRRRHRRMRRKRRRRARSRFLQRWSRRSGRRPRQLPDEAVIHRNAAACRRIERLLGEPDPARQVDDVFVHDCSIGTSVTGSHQLTSGGRDRLAAATPVVRAKAAPARA